MTYDSLKFNKTNILWVDDFSNSLNRNQLESGTYRFVIDETICVDTISIDIVDSSKLEIDSVVTSNNICFGDSLGLIEVFADTEVIDSMSFNWTHDTLLNSHIASSLPNGVYQLKISNNDFCSITYNLTINSNDPITIQSSSKDDHCNDSVGELNYQIITSLDTNELKYSFNGERCNSLDFNDLSKGEYVFTVEDLNGCLFEKLDTLKQVSTIPLSLSVKNNCFLDNSILKVNSLDSNVVITDAKYFINGALRYGNEVEHQFENIGINQVKVIAFSESGCVDSISKEIMINSNSEAIFNDSIEICGFQTIQLNNQSLNIVNSTWLVNNSIISQVENPKVKFDKYGTNSVSLIVKNEFGCIDTFTRGNAVVVKPVPRLNMKISSEFLVFPENYIEVTLTELSDSNRYYIEGDEMSSKKIFFNNTGIFSICSRVISNFNCEAIACKEVLVYDKPQILIPNAFTPNNDGVNDFFEVENININEFNIEIFDRWGQTVFFSNDVNFKWSGEVNVESKSKNDTYFYKIEYLDIFNAKSYKEGTVTILK